MNSPLVSVIVTTYNQQDTIADCLEGILSQQTDFEFEILVGNDCSTDNTADILASYVANDNRIKFFTPPSNIVSTGQSISYKLLLQHAQGQYIAFCEGDDIWISNVKLQSQVNFLKINPEYSACYHDYDILTDSSIKTCKHGKRDCSAHLSDMINLMHCQLSTIVIRRCCLENKKVLEYFNHPTHCYGDINYYASCFEIGKVRYFAQKWSLYRRRINSLTSKDAIDNIAVKKHIGGLKAIVDTYGYKYRYLVRDFKCCRVLDKSSISKNKYVIYSIVQKIKAILISPMFVFRIYLIKWGLK